MPTLTIEIDSSRLQAMLKRLADGCSADLRDGGMKAIGEMLVLTTQERILRGVTPEGNAFKPLSPVTLAIRRAKGRSGSQPLIDTGQLRGQGITYRMEGDVLVISAQRQGVHAVNFGSDRAGRGNKVRIPRRRFMGVSYSDLDEIARIVRHILAQAARGGT